MMFDDDLASEAHVVGRDPHRPPSGTTDVSLDAIDTESREIAQLAVVAKARLRMQSQLHAGIYSYGPRLQHHAASEQP